MKTTHKCHSATKEDIARVRHAALAGLITYAAALAALIAVTLGRS